MASGELRRVDGGGRQYDGRMMWKQGVRSCQFDKSDMIQGCGLRRGLYGTLGGCGERDEEEALQCGNSHLEDSTRCARVDDAIGEQVMEDTEMRADIVMSVRHIGHERDALIYRRGASLSVTCRDHRMSRTWRRADHSRLSDRIFHRNCLRTVVIHIHVLGDNTGVESLSLGDGSHMSIGGAQGGMEEKDIHNCKNRQCVATHLIEGKLDETQQNVIRREPHSRCTCWVWGGRYNGGDQVRKGVGKECYGRGKSRNINCEVDVG
ncbi:hypothetical protein Tco_0105122 [Tanacetum coccineum]